MRGTKHPNPDDMLSVLGSLDMFKEGSDRDLVSMEARADVEDARRIGDEQPVGVAQAGDGNTQSVPTRLPLAVDLTFGDPAMIDPDSIVDDSMVTDAVGLRNCCAKLKAALRAATTHARNVAAERDALAEDNKRLRAFAARANVQIKRTR